jgi:hypothetical protein
LVYLYLSLATRHGNVHESSCVEDSLTGAALGGLALLSTLNLVFHRTRVSSSLSLSLSLSLLGEKEKEKLKLKYRSPSGGLTDLWCSSLDLARTRERAMDLTHLDVRSW